MLERVFPYILGAVDLDYFRLRAELEATQRSASVLQRRLERERSLLEGHESRARALFVQVRDLGLLQADGEGTPQAARQLLREAVETVRPFPGRAPAIAEDPERIAVLEAESRELRRQIASLRTELADLDALAQDVAGAGAALQQQAGRLRAVELLPEPPRDGEPVCPVCSQGLAGVVPEVERLRAVREEVRAEIGGLAAAPAAIAATRETLRGRLSELRGWLRDAEGELAARFSAGAPVTVAEEAWAEQERLIGAIRFYLDEWPTDVGAGEATAVEHAAAEQRLLELRKELAEFDPADRLQAALSSISARMLEYSRRLRVERPGAALWLDVKNLTVVRESPSGAPERLWQIGGGENHVGYHLCAWFALHSFFLERNRPVPGFLFLDQPSQVYFPEQESASDGRPIERRTDWDAVRRIYRMIFDSVRELGDALQVVVLDHAYFPDDPEFQQAVRRRWRDGEKLS